MTKKQIESFLNDPHTANEGTDRNGNDMFSNVDGRLMIIGKGRVTDSIKAIMTTTHQYQSWRSNIYAQTAFKDLSPSDREFIISGNTDDDWKAMFGDPNEPEEEEETDLEPEPAF